MAKAKQLAISVSDRPGSLASAIETLAAAQVNILAVLAYNPGGIAQIVADNPRKAKRAFDGAGIGYIESQVEIVDLPNRPGTLLKFLQSLAHKGINLHAVCATSSKDARKATVVWSVEGKAT